MPNDFTFNPPTGLKDTNVFTDNPLDPRGDIQGLLDQLKIHLNTEFKPLFASGTLADTGSFEIPIGNLKIIAQWGYATTGAATQYNGTSMYMASTPLITFPTPFPGGVIFVGIINNVTSAAWHSATTHTKQDCRIYLTSLVQDQPSNTKIRWFALGF